MAINFSNVKAVSIPVNGVATEVKSIAINGVIVWQGGRALDYITISGYTTTFNVGDTFSFGGTVIATYDNGETEDVTNQATFTGYNMSAAGAQTVTVSFTDGGITETATYSITVYKVLSSITLSGQKTSLNRGATFNFGGTVTAHYNDGSTANVTSSTTFSGYNMSKAGKYTVTASYTYRSVTKTATYSLTVNKAWTAIWTGNKSKTVSTSAGSSVNVWSNISLTGSQTIRITFSMSSSGSGTAQWYNNGSATSTKPGSPLQLTFNFSSSKSNIVGARRYRSGGPGQYFSGVYLSYTYSKTQADRKFYIVGAVDSYTAGCGTVSLTVTKIERYY